MILENNIEIGKNLTQIMYFLILGMIIIEGIRAVRDIRLKGMEKKC
jgi:hypothetical protein